MNEYSSFSSPLSDEDVLSDRSSFLSSPSEDDGLLSDSGQGFLSNSDQELSPNYDQGLSRDSDQRHQIGHEKETTCEISADVGEQHEESISQDKSNSTFNHDDDIEEPKIGMTFDTIEELARFYAYYGKKKGFGVYKRSSRKSYTNDERKYATISCNRAGKSVSKSKNILNPRPVSKTNCPAKVNAVLGNDKKWNVSKVELKHNHPFSPSKGRFYRCHRFVNRNVKRRLEIYQRARVRMNKGFNTFVVESGGYENVPFTEKDCRNYIDKVKRLIFGEGDAQAIQSYFTKVQSSDRDFFYTWDLDEENRLRSLFWADARSRAAYEEFGDVVTFDTTYLTNEYEMPMAPLVGVNHHGQSILLGCGLISNEDTETFKWLFQSWLACMCGRPPKAIITDQDQAMKNAIQMVFPDARHR
uniref:protein FAR-RED IMPAIRED RESPONSE 1-like n=1 Tax=Erigeron canadensis TaxID=72917 RepID=UPI001CB8D3CB|nr:protein FAR-RED IMPAIRED RESPONSE 1-like [Erigeron canadensis]